MSDSLRPHESQHARLPCPSPSPGVHSDSRPSSPWCHPAISSLVVPFSSCPQSLPVSESFPMSQLFTWGGQSTGAYRNLKLSWFGKFQEIKAWRNLCIIYVSLTFTFITEHNGSLRQQKDLEYGWLVKGPMKQTRWRTPSSPASLCSILRCKCISWEGEIWKGWNFTWTYLPLPLPKIISWKTPQLHLPYRQTAENLHNRGCLGEDPCPSNSQTVLWLGEEMSIQCLYQITSPTLRDEHYFLMFYSRR